MCGLHGCRQLQIIPAEDVVQEHSVDFGLLQELLDPGQILVASDAGRDGDDVLGTEHLRRHSFVFDRSRVADRLLREPGRGEELNRESVNEEMLALNSPAAFLQVRVDRRNTSGQPFLGGDEDDVGIVGGKWFDVVDGGKSAAERVVFD